ncbi:MAG: hypothetical protein JWO05_2438 [Gemmatimonadetes bacterium]|nr:hypothetical protein [Gemmatimonadota bacterium]
MTRLTLHTTGGDDPEITHALRDLLAPPADERYWSELEARIMARVPEASGWWGVFDSWMRPALVAAAVLMLAAGVALFRGEQADQQLAYESILTPNAPVSAEASLRPGVQEREATLGFFLSH